MFIYFYVLDPSLNLLVLVISGGREKWKWVEKEREKWKEVLWDAAMNKLQGMSLNLLDNGLDYGISVQFSHSVVSNSLWPHGLQHARPPPSSPPPGVYPISCQPSHSLIIFSFCLQSFPASGSFQMSQFFPSGGQIIGVSASTSVLPVNTQDWSPLGWTGWIFLQSKGLKSLLQHHSSKASILWHSAFVTVQLSQPYMTTGKMHSLD